jgi:hypothetical protein
MKSSTKNKGLIIKADSFNAVHASAPSLNVNQLHHKQIPSAGKTVQPSNFGIFAALNPDWCYAVYMFLFDLFLNF